MLENGNTIEAWDAGPVQNQTHTYHDKPITEGVVLERIYAETLMGGATEWYESRDHARAALKLEGVDVDSYPFDIGREGDQYGSTARLFDCDLSNPWFPSATEDDHEFAAEHGGLPAWEIFNGEWRQLVYGVDQPQGDVWKLQGSYFVPA